MDCSKGRIMNTSPL